MSNLVDLGQLNEKIYEASASVQRLQEAFHSRIVGQEYLLNRLLVGLLSKGHILLEGMPGLAKTLAIKTLASSINGKFSRIQFTPDLLPADIVGTLIYNPNQSKFEVRQGPVFANFVLADEINRAPAKVQAALLEAMQEKQVTIGEHLYKLEEPFLVLATQNPIEQEGTYPLPEAQMDRFMMKVTLDYPLMEDERAIIRMNLAEIEQEPMLACVNHEEIFAARQLVRSIYMDEKIEQYILDIVFATRNPEQYKLDKLKPMIAYGASPRASINLALGAKAYAFIQRRAYVIPEDVRALCMDVMRHRIGITFEAEAEEINAEKIIQEVLNAVDVP